jgi:hypothetical protein
MGNVDLDIPGFDGMAGNDNMTDTFNNLVLAGGEAMAIFSNDHASKHRHKVLSAAYPKGRRKTKCAPLGKKMAKRFNRAANQNIVFANDPEAEIKHMYDLLEQLETLSNRNVKKVFVEEKQNIISAIEKAAAPKMANASFFGYRRAI